ncbi:glycoside hydrolase family 3 N-terminal domain-containing protein [Nocardioides sp. C4-1]|uniref:glycoside hydrolase family 3 N-terminal domain-containing protein n=1 Tax=Nocardioides sp. C4-1 TaxID=3151851 RepID=UPI00326402AB
MSLHREALAVLMPGFATLDAEVAELVGEGLGGLCLFGANTSGDVRAVLAGLRAVDPGLVVAVDEEGGDVTRLHAHDPSGSPVLGAASLGAVDDVVLTRTCAAGVGSELRALDIDLCLGPVADINSDVDNPVIGTRSFGTAPGAVAEHVAAWVTGLRESGAAACAKHFPGHGDTHVDSHLALPVLPVDAETLAGRELVPFAAAIEAGCDAVMTGHLVVPSIDPDRPATLSPAVNALLRERIGPDRVIVTDALDMAGASVDGGIPEAAVEALVAGADLLCLGADLAPDLVRATATAIVAAVDSGRLPAERLSEAARRAASLRRHGTSDLQVDADALVAGARRAISIEGDLPDLTDAFLIRVTTPATIAVGDVPWGLPADLDVEPGADAGVVLAAAAGRPLVAQVRDAHRQPAVLDLLDRLGSPVVVELGWPGPWNRGPRVVTHGCSRPVYAVLTELLR